MSTTFPYPRSPPTSTAACTPPSHCSCAPALRSAGPTETPMADPLDALRQPIVPVEPRPEFVADLRRRLLAELGITTGGTMSNTMTASRVIPYICVSPASDALSFYANAFGAVETLRVAAPDGRIGHAEISIGDARIMLSDEYAEIGVLSPTTLGGSGFALYLEVGDCDAV